MHLTPLAVTSGVLSLGIALTSVACGDSGDDASGGSGASGAADTTSSANASGGNGSGGEGNGGQNPTTSTSGSGGSVSTEGVFVAVGYGGRTLRSLDDGATWVDEGALVPNGGDDNYLLRAVAFGQGKYVGAGWRTVSSSDGATWVDHEETGVNWIGALTFAAGKWVAVGGYGLRATSVDGITWQNFDIDTTASHGSGCLAYGNVGGDRFVSANDEGARAFATDGTDWAFSMGALDVETRLVAFGSGVFVGVGGSARVVSSDGGASFTAGGSFSTNIGGLAYGGGQFVAVGNDHVFTSPDGDTWTDHTVDGIRGGSIAYGHGTFVLLSDNRFRRSANGTDWSAPVEANGQGLEQVTFGIAP